MVHRDLKIGLILGLIILIGVVIKFATDPHLSPRSRMMQLNNESDSNWTPFVVGDAQGNTDSNNLYQDNLFSDTSFPQDEIPEVNTLHEDYVNNIDLGNPQEIFEEIPAKIEPIPEPQVIPETKTSGSENIVEEEKEIIKAEKFYVVRKNETLATISRLYYGTANKWQKIVDANPQIKDPNKIKPGMKLIIPD